jgi:hypothetical protein
MESPNSELWVITDELGEMSEGTKEEYEIWQLNNPDSNIRVAKAQEWRRRMRNFYLNKLVEMTPYEEQEE